MEKTSQSYIKNNTIFDVLVEVTSVNKRKQDNYITTVRINVKRVMKAMKNSMIQKQGYLMNRTQL